MIIKIKLVVAFIFIAIAGFDCRNGPGNARQPAGVNITDSILQVMQGIPKSLGAKGPNGWLDVFENNPAFFMASDGAMAFPDYQAAERFIADTLSKEIQKIDLRWTNIRVDSLSAEAGIISAQFEETLTHFNGQTTREKGYFTATAHQTNNGWKLLNAHWSSKK